MNPRTVTFLFWLNFVLVLINIAAMQICMATGLPYFWFVFSAIACTIGAVANYIRLPPPPDN